MKSVWIALVAAFLSVPAFAAEKEAKNEAKNEAKEVTVKGEVIDTVCYFSHGAKGEKHKECAQKCLKGGSPAALLSSGKLYMLLADHGNEAIMDQVKAKGGEEATITGKEMKKDGMSAMFVTAVK